MKSLADFKRRIAVGVKLHTFNHNHGDFGVPPISIVQTNSFALKTTRTDGRTLDSWCHFPKAKDIEFPDADTAVIYWGEGERREKILTYKFV